MKKVFSIVCSFLRSVFSLGKSKGSLKEDVSILLSYALKFAYENGGDDAVNAKIDDAVKQGKLTKEQGESLKTASKDGVNKIAEMIETFGKSEDTLKVTADEAKKIESEEKK